MTQERQPNSELRAETLRRLIADDSVSWHQTVAQAYDAGRASVQVEANGLIDELKSKATGLADASGFNVTYDVPAGILHKLLAWRDGADFAASIQAEARQQIEELKRERDEWKRVYKKKDETLESLSAAYDELEDKAEKQLAEAHAQAFREAANYLRNSTLHKEFVNLEALAADLEDYAPLQWTVEASEIHNRFCGENGEPCQVCRLKAEREEKK